jgi:hypothetical protein
MHKSHWSSTLPRYQDTKAPKHSCNLLDSHQYPFTSVHPQSSTTMSTEKSSVEAVEDASIHSPNEGQVMSFEGMTEEEMKKFEKKRMCLATYNLNGD